MQSYTSVFVAWDAAPGWRKQRVTRGWILGGRWQDCDGTGCHSWIFRLWERVQIFMRASWPPLCSPFRTDGLQSHLQIPGSHDFASGASSIAHSRLVSVWDFSPFSGIDQHLDGQANRTDIERDPRMLLPGAHSPGN